MKTGLIRLLILMTLFSPAVGQAVFVEERLPDTAAEKRARDIAEDIRCLVCQNQSIMDSNADLAKDLRGIVRERVAAGDSDEDVRQFLVDRYGDWVLLDPPFKLTTFILWVGPLFVFLIAGIATVLFLRRRSVPAATNDKAAPLSQSEKEAFDKLLKEEEGSAS
ncbi:cytochrome c-type biogenesis protein [Sneathiella aquimaris]|uniref:cytochrome c-type biogenesis protein n=1 Tax=Sneathiella aquimaris TaxID=2599305 RepID=UPI00146A1477|nr:cytochrome c-type biogenesis protein [Sneathiella aquimaris]